MEGKGIQSNCQELTFARTDESIIEGERAFMHDAAAAAALLLQVMISNGRVRSRRVRT